MKQNREIVDYLKQYNLIYLNILNYLQHAPECDVITFGGDFSRGIIVCQNDMSEFGDYDFGYMLATTDEEFLAAFWESLPPGEQFFSGAYKPCYEAFLRVTKAETVWLSPCRNYAYSGEGFEFKDDSDHPHDVLTVDDTMEVNKYYTYQHETSHLAIRHSIETRDTSCVRIDGELAAWCLIHADDGSMGPFYVKEKYRRQGLGGVVSGRVMAKMIAKGQVPYAHIVEGNDAPVSMLAKTPFMIHTHDLVWFGVEKV